MRRRLFAVYAAIPLAAGLFAVAGCSSHPNDNVQLDSRKTVHPKTPAEIQAIQNNPNIPAAVKARMLGPGAPPPVAAKNMAGQKK